MLTKYSRTIRLELQYDGSNYSGWQRQTNKVSIQFTLEEALAKIANERVTTFVAGRTDTGVHARKQCVSFSLTKSKTPVSAFVQGTNALLPSDIRVMSAHEEEISFLAIKAAKSKVYRYYFCHSPIENVFLKYVWQIRFKFDLSKMKKALKPLIGQHDFSCFQTHGRETKTSVRTIHRAVIKKDRDHIYYLEIEANGFLRHMVRAIMGTLMEIGTERLPADSMKKIIQSQDRKQAGRTAPAHSLFLWDVRLK